MASLSLLSSPNKDGDPKFIALTCTAVLYINEVVVVHSAAENDHRLIEEIVSLLHQQTAAAAAADDTVCSTYIY